MNIVITGATRGLGRALVDRFLEAGHTVSGCGRSEEAIAALSAHHPDAIFVAVDVSSEEQLHPWAQQTLERFGPPDFLINNAALINRSAPLWEISAEEFNRVMAVNLSGVHHTLLAFLPAMLDAGRGMIINLSSGWGRSTSPEVAPYCTTKWGIEGLTKALAQELPPGLGAVPLNPGIIDTDMLRSAFGEEAGSFPDAARWAKKAAPYILSLTPDSSGKSLTVPS